MEKQESELTKLYVAMAILHYSDQWEAILPLLRFIVWALSKSG